MNRGPAESAPAGVLTTRIVILLVGLTVLVCGGWQAWSPRNAPPKNAGPLTGNQIIQKVFTTYRKVDSIRLVERPNYSGGSGETEIAEAKPGRIRIREDGPDPILVVSNGMTVWAYRPLAKQYLQAEAGPLLEEAWEIPSLNGKRSRNTPAVAPTRGRIALAQYAALPPDKQDARLLDVEPVEINGKVFDCYLVTFTLPNGVYWIWVDKAHYIVWQMKGPEAAGTPVVKHGDYEEYTLPGGGVSQLVYVQLGEVPLETFLFHPPAGAKMVGSFTYNAYGDALIAGLLGLPDHGAIGNTKPPNFALRDIKGNQVELDHLRGKVVVLTFWASWCLPCRKELAAAQRLQNLFTRKRVRFLAIDDESSRTVRQFASVNGYDLTMLLDPEQKVHELYNVRWAPLTVVINRKGKIISRFIGAGGEKPLLRALKKAGLKLPAKSARK